MSGFSTFAIVGLGKLGSRVLAALLSHRSASDLSIRVLTRPDSVHSQVNHPNVTFYPINYENGPLAESQLAHALRSVEVVISTIGAGQNDSAEVKRLVASGRHIGDLPGFRSQSLVARCARIAGCQLFVPAEYGSPTHVLEPRGDSFLRGKRIFQDELRRMQFPYLLVYTGAFPRAEPEPTPLARNTPALPPHPFETTRHHVALFIAHLVLDVPQDALEWGVFMIRGQRREVLVENQWHFLADY
ncbi:hypothetical protein SISNIDRAFT_450955 [Sistotremastrum niveocremeum HHB9708]|uniref:NAD(P)-binding domain-containing protein n=2 Tax=Sistotremastraceae TaxID=3402574 RepID=A0A164XU78_9AGAM|nr:hypothetical protein SISNIDRAFT_450955 [Sistotremastrum niveocremeum HHB9708]KZT37027.1 hypothetical protein SISSUDRAFT_1049045 [Sistotremastrum suecicum HHB10207 ss-3]